MPATALAIEPRSAATEERQGAPPRRFDDSPAVVLEHLRDGDPLGLRSLTVERQRPTRPARLRSG